MYSQSIFGSRWFLPKKYKRSSERNFYKTKSEVLLDQPNAVSIKRKKLKLYIILFYTKKNKKEQNSYFNQTKNSFIFYYNKKNKT